MSCSFCVGLEKPTFDNRCKVFELDPCDGYGRVCLVYKESKTGNSALPIINLGLSDLSPFSHWPEIELLMYIHTEHQIYINNACLCLFNNLLIKEFQ